MIPISTQTSFQRTSAQKTSKIMVFSPLPSYPKLLKVRMMLPMTMRCTTCGNYLYIGTKFNMRLERKIPSLNFFRKETCMNEEYLTIKIYRFYFRCTGCYGEITFKTDPKNHDYIVEHGAKRNYEA